ncbi:ribonuclease H-like domain-containing protein [Portibacter lacus]|uniref:3'-5' exonuclease n=1 Tax=Portibacter lacus TaxID=1099794 RepID=A0AA37SQ87_9BACT|nr:ribonuclease H-like domain-containing protein [Portibacter lacus]GLR17704.1 3'-5' exonuclease [Portibacter lacus]
MPKYISKSKLDNILFLDIETVSEAPTFSALDEDFQKLWTKKAKNILKKQTEEMIESEISDCYHDRAAIFAEFAKIVCITVAYLRKDGDEYEMRIKSFYGDDEEDLLRDFAKILDKHFDNPNKYFLSGHNIKEFDIPFIGRRFLIHGLELPEMINLIGKKPWETKHLLDTLDMWKFGDYKNFISLDLLAKIMKVPSPKTIMDGSHVGNAYWVEKRLEDIKNYCELDVVTSVNVFLRLNGNDTVEKVVSV